MEQLIIFIFLLLIGYLSGSYVEKSHYKWIEKREKAAINLPVVNFKTLPFDINEIEKTEIVAGNAVISVDYFKRMLASLRNVFGGKVKSYESLIDRSRREAILRMKDRAFGAKIILNMRIETSTIGRRANTGKSVGSVEALAYGTAIWIKKKDEVQTKKNI